MTTSVGYTIPGLTEATVRQMRETVLTPQVREAMRAAQRVAVSSAAASVSDFVRRNLQWRRAVDDVRARTMTRSAAMRLLFDRKLSRRARLRYVFSGIRDRLRRRPARVVGLDKHLERYRRRSARAPDGSAHSRLQHFARHSRSIDHPGQLVAACPHVTRGPNFPHASETYRRAG